MTRPVALLDANVLYPARLRDLLIRLDLAGLYQARWSQRILDECFRNLIGDRPDLSPERLARTRRFMTAALPAAMVTGYEDSIEDHDLPDPDDRHVLAAAIATKATLLVTSNLDDFPAAKIPKGLKVVSPDEFVLALTNDDLDVVVEVVEIQATELTNPPMTPSEILDGLDAIGLTASVPVLRSALS